MTVVPLPQCCTDCGGIIRYGAPAHQCRVTMNGRTSIEYRCEVCAERYAEALWPEEEWGPYPRKIVNAQGNA